MTPNQKYYIFISVITKGPVVIFNDLKSGVEYFGTGIYFADMPTMKFLVDVLTCDILYEIYPFYISWANSTDADGVVNEIRERIRNAGS